MKDKSDKNKLTTVLKAAQIFFYIIISSCTIYSLALNLKQTKLIYKPVVGVVDAKITKMLNGTEDTFENVMSVLLKFGVENVGTLPAKDVIINSSGRIGNTFLPPEDHEDEEGIILIPHAKVWNTARIEKNTKKIN
jgi:hypothetical protein